MYLGPAFGGPVSHCPHRLHTRGADAPPQYIRVRRVGARVLFFCLLHWSTLPPIIVLVVRDHPPPSTFLGRSPAPRLGQSIGDAALETQSAALSHSRRRGPLAEFCSHGSLAGPNWTFFHGQVLMLLCGWRWRSTALELAASCESEGFC